MSTHIVRYETKPDRADFKTFQQDAAERMVAPAQRGSATVVGSYGFFGE